MLRSLFRAKAPAPQYPQYALENAAAERWTLPDMRVTKNQAELYQRLAWVNIAVRTIAEACAVQALAVHQLVGEEEEDISNHPFELLMRKPNPLQSRFAFLTSTFSYLKLVGKSYWWINSSSQGAPPDELWIVPPTQLTPIPDGSLYLKGYSYDAGNGSTPITLPPEAIVAFRMWHPLSSFDGLSPIEALAIDAVGELAMAKWNANYFAKNNAKVPGILTFSNMIPDPTWKQMQGEMRQNYGGTERNMMMLRGTGAGAVNWVSTAMSQSDMEFLSGRQFAKEEIYAMFGLPPGMLDKNATEANSTAAKAVFSELTLWPVLTNIAEVITNQLLVRYGDNLVAEFEDPRKTNRALELQEQVEYARTHTIDEIRKEHYGDPPIGDERGKLLVAEISPGGIPGVDVPEKPAPIINVPQPQGEPGKPEEPEPALDEEGAAEKPPEIAQPKADTPLAADLRKWRIKSGKRIAKGQPAACEFESEAIPLSLAAAISGALEACKTADEINAVFDDPFLGYP